MRYLVIHNTLDQQRMYLLYPADFNDANEEVLLLNCHRKAANGSDVPAEMTDFLLKLPERFEKSEVGADEPYEYESNQAITIILTGAL